VHSLYRLQKKGIEPLYLNLYIDDSINVKRIYNSTYSQTLYVSFTFPLCAVLMLKISIKRGDDVNGGFSHCHGRISGRSRVAVKASSQKPFLNRVMVKWKPHNDLYHPEICGLLRNKSPLMFNGYVNLNVSIWIILFKIVCVCPR
jgi:hypothetical protein